MTPSIKNQLQQIPVYIIAALAMVGIYKALGEKLILLIASITMAAIGAICFIHLTKDRNTDPKQLHIERAILFMGCLFFFFIAIILYGVQAKLP